MHNNEDLADAIYKQKKALRDQARQIGPEATIGYRNLQVISGRATYQLNIKPSNIIPRKSSMRS